MHDDKTIARFMAKVAQPANSVACWFWGGAKDRKGYGVFYADAKHRRAHQVSWEIHHRTMFPSGLVGMHACDVPSCVNPSHIKPGTVAENLMDCLAKGRRPKHINRSHVVWRKTHCKRGHELTPENRYGHGAKSNPSGRCRICGYARNVSHRLKKRNAL